MDLASFWETGGLWMAPTALGGLTLWALIAVQIVYRRRVKLAPLLYCSLAGVVLLATLGGVLGIMMSFSVAARAEADLQISIVLLGISHSLHPLGCHSCLPCPR